MFKNPFIIVLLIACCVGCKKEEKRAADVLLMVKETGQLVTAEYTLSKIIKANDNKTWYKVGNRKILMSCEAEVKAGVNLQNVTEENIRVIDDSIALVLPPPQFFSLHIPSDRIQVEYEEVDVLRDPFSAAEREALLAQAERQIRQTVDSLGILETAGTNASLYLESLLKAAGFQKIGIRYHPSPQVP